MQKPPDILMALIATNHYKESKNKVKAFDYLHVKLAYFAQ